VIAISVRVTGAGFLPMLTDVVMVVTGASLSCALWTLPARRHSAAGHAHVNGLAATSVHTTLR
jgi:hypothetical protein